VLAAPWFRKYQRDDDSSKSSCSNLGNGTLTAIATNTHFEKQQSTNDDGEDNCNNSIIYIAVQQAAKAATARAVLVDSSIGMSADSNRKIKSINREIINWWQWLEQAASSNNSGLGSTAVQQ